MTTPETDIRPAGRDEDETVVIPIVTLEEMPRLSEAERSSLAASLEKSEADMKAGKYATYSPEWLRHRFDEIYYGAHRRT
jgi:hypothetical protein